LANSSLVNVLQGQKQFKIVYLLLLDQKDRSPRFGKTKPKKIDISKLYRAEHLKRKETGIPDIV
jgi:hypothetical protein